jgi:hypothetical protein
MPIELFPIPCIDGLDIPDSVIEKCKESYEKHGKHASYETLNRLLYSASPPEPERNLFLYRKAMFLTKKAFMLGEGRMEQEEAGGASRFVREEEWKKKRWAFADSDAVLKMRNISGYGYITESRLSLSQYDESGAYYNSAYNSSTSLSVKKRGGNASVRNARFDFEYKYSSSEYFAGFYRRYVFDTFKRVFLSALTDSVYNGLPPRETEALYKILGQLTDGMKLEIIKRIKDYVLFERADRSGQGALSSLYRETSKKLETVYLVYENEAGGGYTVNSFYEDPAGAAGKDRHLKELAEIKEDYGEKALLHNFIDFLSGLHDALLLPFEFISRLMCALVRPRYEAVIEDSKGSAGSYIFGGNTAVLPGSASPLGPARKGAGTEPVSALIPGIPLLHGGGVTLYENLFISSDQEYNICCFSYNKNAYLAGLPLTDRDAIPFLDKNERRRLLSIERAEGSGGEIIAWFIYSDYIISYDITARRWITGDAGPHCLAGFNIKELLSPGSSCAEACYDREGEILVFLDSSGGIASYDVKNAVPVPSGSGAPSPATAPSHIKLLGGYFDDNGAYSNVLAAYDSRKCQILEYARGGIKKIREYDYYEENGAIAAVVPAEGNKIYILYENHKIIELSTYLYTPVIFQKKKNSPHKIIFGGKSCGKLNETPLYITSDNKAHILHPVYDMEHKESALGIPIGKYVGEGAEISSYKEYFIRESSVALFSNAYYSLLSCLDGLKHPLSKRS